MHRKLRRWLIGGSIPALLAPLDASAHSFGTIYNLPVPFRMYAYGATAALIASFAIIAYFASVPVASIATHDGEERSRRTVATLAGVWLTALRVIGAFALALAIVAGFFGAGNAYTNINMTLFWVIFALGCFYLVALVGDLYALANPWRQRRTGACSCSYSSCFRRPRSTAFMARLRG